MDLYARSITLLAIGLILAFISFPGSSAYSGILTELVDDLHLVGYVLIVVGMVYVLALVYETMREDVKQGPKQLTLD